MTSNRTVAAICLLMDVEQWCMRTGTPESVVGHALFLHPGFVGLLRKRSTVSEEKESAVRAFMAANPDGWRGLLPLTHANGTKPVDPTKRREQPGGERKVKAAVIGAIEAPAAEPCVRCGVRADVGCKHRPAQGLAPIAIATAGKAEKKRDGRSGPGQLQGLSFHSERFARNLEAARMSLMPVTRDDG